MTDSPARRPEPKSEAAAEARYRSLFAAIDEGFALCEVIRDANGEAVDYRILDANAATEAILGIPAGEAIGRTVRELVPDVEDEWIATCARAGLGGESIRLEQYMPWFDQWIEIYLTPNGEPGDGRFAAVYNDRTQRRRAEEALRVTQERQAFLLELGDALRPLADPVAIEAETTRLLGRQLGVNRALYGEVESDEETVVIRRDYVDGLPSVVGVHRLNGFGFVAAGLRAGRTVAFSDAASDSRFGEANRAACAALGIRAGIAVPLVKGGRLVAIGGVHHGEPRQWADQELALIEEVSERTWAAVERARAEEALRASEEKYRTLFHSLDQGVTTIDVIVDERGSCIDYRLIETNLAMAKLTGVTEEVVGKRATEIVSTVDQFWLDVLGRVAGTGEPERVEYPFPALNRWFDVYVSRVGGEGSGRLVCVYQNVTERKRIEARERFLLELSDALRPLDAPDEIRSTAMHMMGAHLGVNRALYVDASGPDDRMEVVPGYVHEVEPWRGPFLPSDFGAAFGEGFNAGQTVTIADVETDPRFADVRDRYAALEIRSALAVPLVKNGVLVAAMGVHQATPRDWTEHEIALIEDVGQRTWAAVERARAEHALRDSQEQLTKALEIETIGVTFFDRDGAITGANDSFLRAGGYTRADLEEGRLRRDDLTPPEWRDASVVALGELEATGRSIPFEKEYLRKDGSRWAAVFAATMLSETRGVEFILDLTDLRAAEAAAREDREQRDQLEREFVANAAHELRTPLTAIVGAVDALNGGAKDDPAARDRFLGHLTRETTRLTRLSDSLLLLAQTDSPGRLQRSRVGVRSLLEEVAAELQLSNGVTARVTAPRTLEVLTHRGLVERIVANLVENAVKHTQGGCIELRGKSTKAAVLIEVCDTGSGISEETRERAFDRFYRGGSRTSDGFGLGLSIAQQAAAVLDGEIVVEPRRGGGTVARLVLPSAEDR